MTSHASQAAVPDLGSGRTRARRLVRATAVTVVVVTAAAAGFLLGGRDDPATLARSFAADPALAAPGWSERIGLKYQRYPAWFRNVAKLYGYDSRLTPDFDFASLYGVPRDQPASTR